MKQLSQWTNIVGTPWRKAMLIFCGSLLFPTGNGGWVAWAADAPMTWTPSSQAVEWTLSFKGRPVMVYASDPQKPKPYVKALNTTEGYGVLRDSPADHLHHHALMYGIRVNGFNFWEETSGCGVQKVVQTVLSEPSAMGGGATGSLRQIVYWVAPEDAFLPNTNCPALLQEERTLTVGVDPAMKQTSLLWHSRFKVGTKTNTVVLTGANYHGLGMRFQRELDAGAIHLTPTGLMQLTGNRQDYSVFPWEAVTFTGAAAKATIAIFGSRTNARSNPRFFAMAQPFAYLSATQALDGEPLVYHAGDSFELKYLVVLYPEVKKGDELNARFQEFERSGQ